jgi:hypothetical protein
VAVVLDHHAATGCGHHDRFRAGFHIRPPCIDIAARIFQAAIVIVHVIPDRAAAAGPGRDDQLHAERIEYAGSGGIDIGRHRRLHAAVEQQHLARMLPGRPRAGFLPCGHLVLQRPGQQRPHQLPDLHCGRKQPFSRQRLLQYGAQNALRQRTRHLVFDDLATDIDQPAVLHARRASRFAIAAGQAAVQVQLGFTGCLLAFQDLLHQIDAAARTIQLVAQQLISRTGCGAEAAMHALAQDGIGFFAFAGILDELG